MSRVLVGLRQEGYPVDADAVAALSPYLTAHLTRFGRYTLDRSRIPPALDYELPILSNQQEQAGPRPSQP